jgi:excisionase family DNA binding protein
LTIPFILEENLTGVAVVPDEPMLTVEDVAKELNIHPNTVRSYIASGELKALKLKREYRIRRADLDDFIKRHLTNQDYDGE